jgi:site-specific recombinase XerD
MSVANRSASSIRSYCRAIEKLSIFQQDALRSLEIDQLIDFLYHLHHDKGLNWRTIKLYVAGLRYYYQEVVDNVTLAHQIPYPKEKPSLPVILSRQEFFNNFLMGASITNLNYKHKVMFRLIYSAGLRRSELANLKIKDIETLDGNRIRPLFIDFILFSILV